MNEEKDRFGDFIRLLERAREDVYFAEKDRELIDRLKRHFAQGKQSKLANPAMNCPQCAISLHNSSLMDFAVSRCSGCGGIWVNRDVLHQFLNMKKIEPGATHFGLRHSLRNMWPDKNRQVSE